MALLPSLPLTGPVNTLGMVKCPACRCSYRPASNHRPGSLLCDLNSVERNHSIEADE